MILRFFAIADFAFFFTGYNKVDLPTNPPAPWLAVKPSVCVGGGGGGRFACLPICQHILVPISFLCVCKLLLESVARPPKHNTPEKYQNNSEDMDFPLSSIYCTVWSRSIRLYILNKLYGQSKIVYTFSTMKIYFTTLCKVYISVADTRENIIRIQA